MKADATVKTTLMLVFLMTSAAAPVAARAGAEEPAAGQVILDLTTRWRFRMVTRTDRVRRESGKLEYIRRKMHGSTVKELAPCTVRTMPAPPAKGWAAPEFDDRSWGRMRGKFEYLPRGRAVLYLRGRFEVKQPADLSLTVKFQGGAVAYVNGKEIGRAHLPKGEITSETPAEDYPKAAYVFDKGKSKGKLIPMHPYHKYGKDAPEFAERMRLLTAKIPASALRKGVNVVAVQVNRAPAPEAIYKKRGGGWSRLGLEDIRLSSPAGAGVVPGIARPKGFQIWNCDMVDLVSTADWGDPCEGLRPVRIVGVRNGTFSGQVVASSGSPIRGLKATAGKLAGPGGATIPAAAVSVLWALPDRVSFRGAKQANFDTLDEAPPEEVPVAANGGGAVQPMWISVKVPAEAKAGEYKGKVTVSVQGQKPVEVPIELKVVDWKLPDTREFTTFMGIVQSPDTLAVKYGVKMWSEEHWKLVERSFELLGRVGAKALYVPIIAKTHFGNAHSMVRWEKGADGSYKHDFSIAERYVKTAAKHLGKIPVVCLYIWEPAKVGPHYEHNHDYGERKILFSVREGASGKLEVKEGPEWGTEECVKFLRPVFDGMRRILKTHKLGGSAMVGLCDDFTPSEKSVGTLKTVAPEMKWVVHSHVGSWLTKGVRGRPVGHLACLWGMWGAIDPDTSRMGKARAYGWKYPVRLCTFPRGAPRPYTHPALYRTYPESAVTALGKWGSWDDGSGKKVKAWSGADGIGRMGADFWYVLKDKRGRLKSTLAGHYSYWGGLDLNRYSIPNLLGPGGKRPQPTGRFEMFRQTIQENEARFFLERILTDKARRAKLGEELAKRAQEILDERVRACLTTRAGGRASLDKWRWFVGSDWQERSERLYAAAAEAAKKLGGK